MKFGLVTIVMIFAGMSLLILSSFASVGISEIVNSTPPGSAHLVMVKLGTSFVTILFNCSVFLLFVTTVTGWLYCTINIFLDDIKRIISKIEKLQIVFRDDEK